MKRIDVSLAVVVLSLAVAGFARAEPAELKPTAKMESRSSQKGRGDGPFGDYWWANRFLTTHQQVQALRGKTVDLVLVGDSIMHFWEWKHPASWAKLTANRSVLNLGFGGDRTEHVLWRLEHGSLDGFTAKNIVLMIGTNNNTAKTTDPANVAKGIEKIVSVIRAKQPDARLILHPIFPRGVSAASAKHASAKARNDVTNALIADFARKDGKIVWIDFNAQLVDASGWVPSEIMADQIHPTDKGYDIWMAALLPALR